MAAAKRRVAVAATGVANLASVLAGLRRAGAEPFVSTNPQEVAEAELAVLPGVGAFGPAVDALRATGVDEALAERVRAGKSLLAVCVGMQLCFEASEESPGARGLGFFPGTVRRFGSSLPLPQLGWNRIAAALDAQAEGRGKARAEGWADAQGEGPGAAESVSPSLFLRPGWAYFANSYRVDEAPPGSAVLYADYGGRFVAALESGCLLLCQFHPELSGELGRELLERWIASAGIPKGETR